MSKIIEINWRAYCVSGLLCCLALTLAGCSDRKSEQYRAEGDTLRGMNRIEAARTAYENSLEANPANPMAKLGLARCSAAEGSIDDALALFRESISMDPGLDDAYGEAVRMLVGADRMDEALTLSSEYAQQAPEKGRTMYGVVLLKMGRTDEAIETLAELSGAYPESEQISLDLANAYLKGGQSAKAEEVFQKVVERGGGNSVAARMGLVDVYRAQGRTDELVQEFAALAEARPEDMGIKLGYARSLLLADQPEEAEAKAREILELEPESGWANYVVGYRKAKAGDFAEATAYLEQAVRALPDEAEIKTLLAYARSGGAEPMPTENTAAKSTERAPATAGAQTPLTWEDLWKQAALTRFLDNQEAYLEEGGDAAREALTLASLFTYQAARARELADGLPETSNVRVFIDAFFAKDTAAVAAHFEKWKEDGGAEDNLLRDNALGFAMVQTGAREQGLSVFLFCLERWPDHCVALFNIAQVFRRLGQPMIAAQNLQRLIGKYPENIDAHQMLYTALQEGKAFDAARRAAEASYTLFPDERWSHLNLCQAYLNTGEPALALQWLGKAKDQFPNDPELQAILGSVLVRVGDCSEASNVLSDLSTTAAPVISARDTLLTLCRVLDGDLAGAVTIAKGIAPANRSDSAALILAVGLSQGGDLEAARALLLSEDGERTIGGKYGTIVSAALGGEAPSLTDEEKAWAAQLGSDKELLVNYVTAISLQMADLNDASWLYYQEHLASRPSHIALAQLAFRALGRKDSKEDIGESARAVAESLSDDVRAWIGLASVLGSIDDEEGEAAAVEKALEVGPKNPEAIFRHASLMERQGKSEAAVADYRVLLEIVPESGAANNNLAYTLLLAGGHDDEALKHALVASEALPTDAGVLHTLGLAQMQTGDLEESRKHLKRAAEMDPANPTIMFDYGRLLAKLDESGEARKRIEYSLAMSRNAGIDFPQASEAEALLETMQ